MNIEFSIFIHLILGIVIIFYELFRSKNNRLDAMFFISVYYFLLYVYVPISLYIYPEWADVGAFKYLSVNNRPALLISFLSIFGYFLIISGRLFSIFVSRSIHMKSTEFKISNSVIFTVFIIGVFSYFMYTNAFGGISNSIMAGSAVRYGLLDIDDVVSGNGLVFKRLLSALELLLFYFIGMKFYGAKFNNHSNFLFITTFILYILYLFSASSRGALIVIMIYVVYLKDRFRVKLSSRDLIRFLTFGIFGLVFMLFGKQFLYAVPELISGNFMGFIENFEVMNASRQGDDTSFLRDTLFKEFSNGYVSLICSLDYSSKGSNDLLFFRDYLMLPVDIIPMNILGLSVVTPPSISAINSFILQGELVASMPPGILAMLIYNLSFLGILALFFFGFFVNLLETFFFHSEGIFGQVLYFYLILLCGAFVSNSDIKVLVFDSLFPFLFMFLFSVKLCLFNRFN